jgi:hypothetical protein
MNSSSFIQEYFNIIDSVKILTSEIRKLYVTYYNGTTGINKFYNYLKTDLNLKKDNKYFYGITLKNNINQDNNKTDLTNNINQDNNKTDLTNNINQDNNKTDLTNNINQDNNKTDLTNNINQDNNKTDLTNNINQDNNKTDLTEFEKRLLQVKKEKINKQEELKKLELQQQEKLQKLELQQQEKLQKELKEMDIKAKERITNMKIQAQKEIAEDDRKHQSQENNKIKQLSLDINFNSKVDFKIYGTFSKQYIDTESFNKVLNNIEKSFDIKMITEYTKDINYVNKDILLNNTEKINSIDSDNIININNFIKNNINNEENNSTNTIKEFNKSLKIVDKEVTKALNISLNNNITSIYKNNKQEMNELLDLINNKINEIKNSLKNNSFIYSMETKRLLNENYKKNNMELKKLERIEYIRKENNIIYLKNIIYIDCYCCKKQFDYKDSHRSHIVSQKNGGTWCKSNIVLCCPTCNIKMKEKDLLTYKKNIIKKNIYY